MVEGNHWDQWFSDGFGVRQPLVTMVFDGCAPLVRQWNGYVPSLKSIAYRKKIQMSSTLDARRTNLGMFKNHNEKLNFRKDESDNRYIAFRLVNNGINQVAANIEYIK